MKSQFTKTLVLLMLMMVSVGAWAKVQTEGETVFAFDSKEAIIAWGYSAPTNSNPGTDLPDHVQFQKDGITVQVNKGSSNPSRFWYENKSYELRIYNGGSIVITAPTDYSITSVSFIGTTVSFSCEGYDNETHIWKGEAASVTFNAPTSKSSIMVSNITVKIEKISNVPTTATITLNSACTDGSKVYGTYSNASAWVVPAALTVSEIGVDDDVLNVESYSTGSVVPANTGVMVSAEKWNEGTKDFTVNLSDEAGTSVLGSANCLRPTGDAGITAEQMATADANCTYYRLTMHNGTQIGFWWGAENGAAFALGANKAYLAVANDNLGARTSLWFDDNEEALESIEMKATTTIYTLDGMKVNEFQKGLNIMNGKKIMVRE